MEKAEFDRFAEEYASIHAANIAITGESPDYFAEYKIRDLADEFTARTNAIVAPTVLDFGAGVGNSVPLVRKYLPSARLTCLDVSAKSLEVGSSRFPGCAEFIQFDGTRIPVPDASFHIVFAACVFHHIDGGEHVGLLSEFRRVLAPGGMAFVFEHNPANPLTTHAVNKCPFDENAKLIPARTMRKSFESAGFNSPQIRFRIFFPRLLSALRPLEMSMTWLPLGAQYYAFAEK
jgi:ubiquinone/menaquinone biosynthesis C-methylase UbiE